MRLLEKGLHGGLGKGNVGLVLAGHGVGKSAFLVGLALDTLLRDGQVLHVSLDHTVSHVRAWYDTLFEELASSAHLEEEAQIHAEIDRRRNIRAYPPGGFSAGKLREALKVEAEAGLDPDVVIVEGYDLGSTNGDAEDFRALAGEIDTEIWHSVALDDEEVKRVPAALAAIEPSVSVIVALEPGSEHVRLRALKDHDNPDLSALHVALDPKTLLLVRS